MAGGFLVGMEEDGLETAVLISLFSDARAVERDELPACESNPRGWWAERLEGRAPFGCKWWLRWRDKQTPEVAARFADDARAALRWMVDDKIAARVDVRADWVRRGVLGFEVVITLTDGTVKTLSGQAAEP